MTGRRIVKLGKRLTIWLPERTVRQLRAQAELEGRPKSRLVEDAVKAYLKHIDGRRA